MWRPFLYFCTLVYVNIMKKFFTLFFLLLFAAGYAQDRSDSIHVTHYDLHLSVTDFTHQRLSGFADLDIVAKVNLVPTIVLDLEALTVDSVWVNGQITTFTRSGNKINIPINNFHQGDTALVRVYYQGVPVHDATWGGFYFSGQYAYNMGVGFSYVPHNLGRAWYPCLDYFTDKSTYTMHIRTLAGHKAVCGGLLTDSVNLGDTAKIWTWQLNEPIPTYLASVAVGDYRLYADTFHGMNGVVPIQIYAQPTTINKVAASFVHLKQILNMYEQNFGPYRWPRVGYVLVNFNSGAMEHATNIAYPNALVDGTLSAETLYAHELFHHWFGDLITCQSASEMWINEGFATYAEALTQGLENSTPTNNAYLNYIRDTHFTTLLNVAKDDGGHYALDSIPINVTYGTHSYQKAACVIHSLRSYMGDSLFFVGCRALLNHFAFQNVSSEELFNYLSQVTGLNLHDFYDAWVHQPGYLQFSIDSIRNLDNNGHYRVYLHQKLYAAHNFALSNKVDLTFIDQNRNLFTVPNVTFSGEFASVEVTLPFTPLFGMVDYNEKLCDAVIDYNQNIYHTGSYTFPSSNVSLKVDAVTDTVFMRLENNMVSPDEPIQMPERIVRISHTHYWNIVMVGNSLPQGQLSFRYQRGSSYYPDYELMQGYAPENLHLLYRATPAEPWQLVPVTRSGSTYSGYLKTDHLAPGQYCFAVGDIEAAVDTPTSDELRVYPNPASQYIDIQINNVESGKVILTDSAGRNVRNSVIKEGRAHISLSGLSSGLYMVRVMDHHRQVKVERLIKVEE